MKSKWDTLYSIKCGGSEKRGIDVKFVMDKQDYALCMPTKFHALILSASLLKCCKMLYKRRFLHFFEQSSQKNCGIGIKFHMSK